MATDRQIWLRGQRLQRAAFRHLRGPFARAVKAIQRELAKLGRRASAGEPVNLIREIEELPWEEEMTARMEAGWAKATEQLLSASVGDEEEELKKADHDLEQQLSREFIESHSLQKATELTRITVQGLRSVLEQGIRQNDSVSAIIRNLKDSVGLTRGMVDQLGRMQLRAEERGLKGDRLHRFVALQREKMIDRRVEAIARTETNTARNQGTLHGWLIALEEGGIRTGARKRWITNGPCEICREIAKLGSVPINARFPSPLQGVSHMAPPAHVNCRCSMKLVV